MSRPRSFMVVAGEPSGDQLAAELVRALREELTSAGQPAPEFFGAGGSHMEAAGVSLSMDLTRHAVVGLVDVARKFGQFRRMLQQLVELAFQRQPDAIICVDFGGFNSRLVRAIRERLSQAGTATQGWQPRLIQFVSPQVWASRPGRAQRLERHLDLLLSILPFEPEWYARHAPGLRVEFVGHPIVDRHAGDARAQVARAEEPLSPRVVLLPGSRRSELQRHLPVMIAAAQIIREQEPETDFTVVLPKAELEPLARAQPWPGTLPVDWQVGGLDRALRSATVALASTGTVTLECAWFGVPTVALYKTSALNYAIGKRLIRVPFLAMPNLLAGEEVMPEFIQKAAQSENLARSVVRYLKDETLRSATRTRLLQITGRLGEPGAPGRAARAILRLFHAP